MLQDEITVSVGSRAIKKQCSSCGVAHSFTIESEQLRMLIILAPAGMEGWFKEFSVPAGNSLQRDTKNA